ncbi:hypothetical protein M951_chr399 (nucleomorph) [Lotharella oceanica]|uniref:Uncharacterized protein n=1 Tax=Lotharella oceanica TaxID=641309 RepID=A0A060DGR0_9EUKA|nr:hypothetical protein M951_chr399 [Lotharella oceanica]
MATLIGKSIKGLGVSGYMVKIPNFFKKKNNLNKRKIERNFIDYISNFKKYITITFILSIKLGYLINNIKEKKLIIKKIVKSCYDYDFINKNKMFLNEYLILKYNNNRKNLYYYINFILIYKEIGKKLCDFGAYQSINKKTYKNKTFIYSGINLYKYLLKNILQ